MENVYEVRLYSWTGTLQAVFDSWRSLELKKRLNGISSHTLAIDANDIRVPLFIKDYFVEIRRVNHELGSWVVEYRGFHRTPRKQITQNGHEIFTSYGRSFEDLLRRRVLLYYAPYGKTAIPADDAMKQFVLENAGTGAVVTGIPATSRFRNGVFTGFSVAPQVSAATVWSGDRTYKNLLDVIQEISVANSVDFAVLLGSSGYGTYEFQTYYPYGADRTVGGLTPHIFSPEYGNITIPDYTVSATEEVTAVTILGTGLGAGRDTLNGESIAINDSPWNSSEATRDARNQDGDQLYSILSDELLKGAAQESLTCEALQVPSSLYGVHYNVGDFVTIQFGSVTSNKRILGVDILVNDTVNKIDVDFGDVLITPKTPQDALTQIVTNIKRKLGQLEHNGDI